jgi:hypothetical protein
VLSNGGAFFSIPLVTEGVPVLSLWANQTAPLVAGQGATVTMQFMVRAVTGGDTSTSDEWLDLGPSIVLAPGVPGVVFGGAIPFIFPASKIRLKAVRAAGAPLTSIDYVLGANA